MRRWARAELSFCMPGFARPDSFLFTFLSPKPKADHSRRLKSLFSLSSGYDTFHTKTLCRGGIACAWHGCIREAHERQSGRARARARTSGESIRPVHDLAISHGS